MTDHQKPWDSTKPYDQYTDIEKVFLWVWTETIHDKYRPIIQRAWAALCDKCREGKP